MADQDPPSLFQEYRAKCSICGFEKKFEEAISAGYKLGSVMYQYPGDDQKGKCARCRSHTMVIIKVPDPPETNKPEGFWKIPEV